MKSFFRQGKLTAMIHAVCCMNPGHLTGHTKPLFSLFDALQNKCFNLLNCDATLFPGFRNSKFYIGLFSQSQPWSHDFWLLLHWLITNESLVLKKTIRKHKKDMLNNLDLMHIEKNDQIIFDDVVRISGKRKIYFEVGPLYSCVEILFSWNNWDEYCKWIRISICIVPNNDYKNVRIRWFQDLLDISTIFRFSWYWYQIAWSSWRNWFSSRAS